MNKIIENELANYNINSNSVVEDGKEDIFLAPNMPFKAMQYVGEDIAIKFRIYIPENLNTKQKTPVVFWLHGACEKGTDNVEQVKNNTDWCRSWLEKQPYLKNSIVIMPQCPVDDKWLHTTAAKDPIGVQYKSDEVAESKSLGAVLKILKYYNNKFELDENRILFAGFSMGAYGCFDLLVRHTNLVSSIIAISGGCDTSKYEKLLNKKIFMFHALDDCYVNPNGTITMYKSIKNAGGNNVHCKLFSTGGHFICDQSMNLEGLQDWFFGVDNKKIKATSTSNLSR